MFSSRFALVKSVRLAGAVAILLSNTAGAGAQSATFAGTAQHTSLYSSPAQHLNRLRWSTPIDLRNPVGFAHYGAPLITLSNTVITPVLTASNSFLIKAFEGETG